MAGPLTRYWIGTASRDHIQRGVEGGFAQVCHGKQAPLKRMKKDDWIIYYSPKKTFNGQNKLQCFTAIGKIADQNVYQVEMFPNFKPFRRNVTFIKDCRETPISGLLDKMEFTAGKKNWGARFRFGLFEISSRDFKVIKKSLLKKRRIIMLEVTHTEFAKATPESVWSFWSNTETWPTWDKGVEWCNLEEKSSFQLGGKATLMPIGAPAPVSMEITECEVNRLFTDEAKTDLGTIKLIHLIEEENERVKITHSMQFFPINEQTKKIFENVLLPKMQKELPESVKTLASLVEKECAGSAR